MTNIVSALTARTQLGQIMKQATKNGERFVVDRRGEPQVVIMSIDDFIKTIAPEAPVLAAIRSQAKAKGTSKLTMRQINAEISGFRKESRRSKPTK
jgi:prevent-host-death family protein